MPSGLESYISYILFSILILVERSTFHIQTFQNLSLLAQSANQPFKIIFAGESIFL